jgi:hypothetical protein
MKLFISKMFLIVDLLLITKCIHAQNYNDYRDAEAIMLRMNGNGFSPGDFNLNVPGIDTRFLIRIGDAPVNRL